MAGSGGIRDADFAGNPNDKPSEFRCLVPWGRTGVPTRLWERAIVGDRQEAAGGTGW